MDFRERLNSILGAPMFNVGETTLTLGTAGLVLLIAIVSFWLSRLTRKAIVRAFRSRLHADEQAINAKTQRLNHLTVFNASADQKTNAGAVER